MLTSSFSANNPIGLNNIQFYSGPPARKNDRAFSSTTAGVAPKTRQPTEQPADSGCTTTASEDNEVARGTHPGKFRVEVKARPSVSLDALRQVFRASARVDVALEGTMFAKDDEVLTLKNVNYGGDQCPVASAQSW